MEQTVAMEVPRAWLEGVSDEPLTLQEIFRVGLYHYKVERALRLYREEVGSLGFLAEQLGIPKRELIREARQRGIDPGFSAESVQEDLLIAGANARAVITLDHGSKQTGHAV